MKRKGKIILTLACAALGCLCLGACRQATDTEKLEAEGNIISVTYHSNGGMFWERTGVTIVDMFDPDKFTDADGDGKIEISLKSTDPYVAKHNGQTIGVPTRTDYSFAGWYQNRTVVTDENGEPVDDKGTVLELRGDTYYVKGAEKETAAQVAYTYSDKWDFDEDKLVYELGSGSYSLTLYAAWLPYYRFDFYYEKETEDENGAVTKEWTLLGSEGFDYAATQRFHELDYGYEPALKPVVADGDCIYIPQWSDENDTGAMNYSFEHADGSTFKFPTLAGHTFRAAYSDKACTQEITSQLRHGGTLTYDEESGELGWHDRVQNIYVKFDEGEQYRITTAKQFVEYAVRANASSVYTILADELDFGVKDANGKDIIWPSSLSSGEFSGTIVGNGCTFKNITAANGDTSVTFGGLFGTIGSDASIENITFENVSYDMDAGTTARGFNVMGYYGIFAGIVETGAKVSGIQIKNATLIIGNLELKDYTVNLACGNAGVGENIRCEGARIVLKAWKDRQGKNLYFVSVNSVDEGTGAVAISIADSSLKAIERPEETFVAYPVAGQNESGE